jgi:methyl-accepting chemotaxis protein
MLQEGRTDAPIGRVRFAGSLRGRLLLAALAVTAPLLLGAGLWILLLSHSAREYRKLASEAVAKSDASVVLLQHLNEAEEAGIDYMETGSALALREFRRTASRIDRELSDTGRYDESAEVIAFVSIRHPWELAKEHIANDSGHAAPQDTFAGHMHNAANGLEHLMAGSQVEVSGELAATERAARLNWLLGLSAVAGALLLAAFLATRLSRSLVRPLEQLAQAARSLAAGHLGHRVAIGSPPS